MRVLRSIPASVSAIAALLAAGAVPLQAAPRPPLGTSVRKQVAAMPLTFVQNEGQEDARVAFKASGPGGSLSLMAGGFELALPARGPDDRPVPEFVRMRFAGANPGMGLAGEKRLDAHTGFFKGSDPSKWQQDVPTYARARYNGVYPGTDMVVYGTNGKLEYDWILSPGADPSCIQVAFEGVRSLKVDAKGDLVARTSHDGKVRQAPPAAYQMVDGERRSVVARFKIGRDHKVGFTLGDYDRNRELIIDPVLSWSRDLEDGTAPSYGGVYTIENNGGVALDATTGDVVIGWADYTEPSGGGVYSGRTRVMRLSSDGNTVRYNNTYGGGASFTLDYVYSVALDASGDAYLVGNSNDTSFPVTTGTLSSYTTYVLKLNSSGGTIYSSMLNSLNGLAANAGTPIAYSIAVDSNGSAFICGSDYSETLPTTGGVFQPAHFNDDTNNGLDGIGNPHGDDAWVAKLDPASGAITAATYFGGDDWDDANAIAVDGSNNVILVGGTCSSNLAMGGAYQTVHGGNLYDTTNNLYNYNGFVAKFSNDLTTRTWSTFFGGNGGNGTGSGSGTDEAMVVTTDASGNVYAGLGVQSTDLPTSGGAFQTSHGSDSGGEDVYIAKFNSSGSSLAAGSYFGGSAAETIDHISVDPGGSIYFTGTTLSPNFPSVHQLYSYDTTNGSPYLARLSADGTGALVATSLNNGTSGPMPDGNSVGVTGMALDSGGNVYLAGIQTTFPGIHIEAAELANVAPTASAANLGTIAQGGNLTVTYAALQTASGASDGDGDSLVFVAQGINNGTLTIGSSGGPAVVAGVTQLGPGMQWVWTPTVSTSGASVAAFTFSAYDGHQNSSPSAQASANVTADTTPATGTFDVQQGGSSVSGGTVSGTVTLTATATDTGAGVLRVGFYIDGKFYKTVFTPPYTVTVDTTKLTNGSHDFLAYALDNSNNFGFLTPEHVFVTTNNADTIPPTGTATITGTTGTLNISATASDQSGIQRVTFYIDGHFYKSLFTGPYATTLDSTQLANGSHTFLAYAIDGAGNFGYLNHGTTFTVSN